MPKSRTTAYQRSYLTYKRTQQEARHAVVYSTACPTDAEELFLKQAQLRKAHCEKYFDGKWDKAHKRAYDIAIGTAWIQRQYAEDERVEDEINYERTQDKKKEKYSVWRKKPNNRESFAELLEKHQNLKSKKSKKN